MSKGFIMFLSLISMISCNNKANYDTAFNIVNDKLIYQRNDSLISNLIIGTNIEGQLLQFISGEKHPDLRMYALVIFINEEEKKKMPRILKILESINYKIDEKVFLSGNGNIRIDFNNDLDNANFFARRLFEEVHDINSNGIKVSYETYNPGTKKRTNEMLYP